MEKVAISLDILLPEIPHERDACVNRIISSMQRHKGIEGAHLVPASEGDKAQLCFYYDSDVLSIEQVEQLAKEAGATITEQYAHLVIEVENIREMIDAEERERQISELPGVADVSVSATGIIWIEFEMNVIGEKEILDAVDGVGLRISRVTNTTHKIGYNIENDSVRTRTNKYGYEHSNKSAKWKTYAPVIICLAMLLTGIAADTILKPAFFINSIRFGWYAIAYLLVGVSVALNALKFLLRGEVFTEFFLMTIATVGAFYVGEFPEGVAVMLFYTIGEIFQNAAVNRAKRSIKALLDIRPNAATLVVDGSHREVSPSEVNVGDTILVKVGERVPLDAEMLSEGSSFNTAALTGESRPNTKRKGELVLAGMINLEKVVELKVIKLFEDSSLARILTMVQEATTRKAKTELFLRRFARVYTPIVVFLAIGLTFIPYFVVEHYSFNDWLYRALIFLVISCPCALVISIPLGYFGGIGAASRHGILFKGSNYLDLITRVNTVVLDKTGTLTKGVFKVQQVESYDMPKEEWLPLAGALESKSTHPIAKAVVEFAGNTTKGISVSDIEEISGHGLRGKVDGIEILVGNTKLMDKYNIGIHELLKNNKDTGIMVAVNNQLVGFINVSDEIKEDSIHAVEELHKRGIESIMLSGDKQEVVEKIAEQLNIDSAHGSLLPEQKVEIVENIKKDKNKIVAFAGDGINDAPVLALSDVGIAMGALGSDAAIESADVVIQTDQPSRIATAVNIGKATNKIVRQNIGLAFGVKLLVMIFGAWGIATMWEAVFADVGVALLAILNAVRIQRMKFI